MLMNIQTPYIWLNGSIIPWEEAKDHTVTHALHYGTSVFEGIRFYKTDTWPGIFRLKEHIDRLFYSMKVLDMEIDYSIEDIINATKEIVKVNKIESWYIRPIVWYGYWKMWLNPKWAKVNVEISVWKWGKYLSDRPINVKVSKFRRINSDAVVIDAKVGWYYVNSVFANLEVEKQWFDEALLLDANWYIAEWPWENIFFIKWNTLYTPSLWSILPGITRDTIINAVAPEMWFEIVETNIKLQDLSEFDEAFFVWTAAEVTPIWFITDLEDNTFEFVSDKSLKIRDFYMDLVHWKVDKFLKFISVVDID